MSGKVPVYSQNIFEKFHFYNKLIINNILIQLIFSPQIFFENPWFFSKSLRYFRKMAFQRIKYYF